MRTDPSFCPTARRYSWEEYRTIVQRNPNVVNFPTLPSPAIDEPFNETNFLITLDGILEKYKDVPNATCMLLCKFIKILSDCIKGFKELQH